MPGSDMPSASATAFIVDAVPIVLQWPADGAKSHARRGTPPRRSRRPRAACARSPDHRAGADQLAVVPAVEHRPAGQHDRRDVDGRRGHDLGRRRLVAARRQHDGVDRIAVQDLDQPQIGQVAIERRGRPPAILEDRVQREFHRNAARVADAVAHALRPVPDGCDCRARGRCRIARCR